MRARTDARVLETATGRQALAFSRSGTNQADIIAHVDELAGQINVQLLGRQATQPIGQRPSGGTAGQTPPAGSDIHQHPEKLLPGIGTGQGLLGGYGEGGAANVRMLLRGRRMDRQIRGVTSGDVDGDGVTDIVCIDSRPCFNP